MRRKLLEKFLIVLQRRREAVLRSLVRWRAEQDEEFRKEILRELHTLKGEARMLRLKEASEFLHQLEDAVRAYLDRGETPSEQGLERALDGVFQYVEATLRGEKPSLPRESLLKGVKAEDEETEPLVYRRKLDLQFLPISISLLEEFSGAVDVLEKELRSLRRRALKLRREKGNVKIPLEFLHTLEDLEGTLQQLLQFRAQVFLMPFSEVLSFLEQAVEELCQRLGKRAELHVEGQGVRLDKEVLEKLIEPLLHLVQNALDHGIESEEERIAQGKPPVGQLHLSLVPRGRLVELHFSDDGRGIDWERIKRKALDEGLLQESEEGWGPKELTPLLFRSGFSTCSEANLVSGRGVGLEVVQHSLESLGGSVEVESQRGRGTTFRLTFASRQKMLSCIAFQVGQYALLVPTADVLEVGKLELSQVQEVGGTLYYGEQLAPLYFFHPLVGEATPPLRQGLAYIVLPFSQETKPSVWVVDCWLGETTLWIKPVNGYLSQSWVIGGSRLSGGELALLVSLSGLWQRGSKRALAEVLYGSDEIEDSSQKVVLLVEDSFITREMEKNLLAALPVRILEAENGREAWEILKSHKVDLVITDLEMPEMDGLELVRKLKEAESTCHIPVFLVTTRGEEEEKRAGLEAGADGYFVKGEFQPEHFLQTVRDWLQLH